MNYDEISDSELFSMVCEANEEAKDRYVFMSKIFKVYH